MRRKLYFVNESGTAFHLDYAHGCLIEAVDGLGFEFDIEYGQLDSGFVETKRSSPQRTISMTLVFLDGYAGFTRWREFVTKGGDIRLFYACDGTKYCHVNVRSSTKSQLEGNALRTEATIDCLTLWLVNRSYSLKVKDRGGGKLYAYSYPHQYSVSFSGTVAVRNASPRSVPLLIRMKGNLYNPRVIVRNGGEDLSTLRLLVDERGSPTIEVSAYPADQYIRKTEGGMTTDYYDRQDFSCENFLRLPSGDSEIFFDPGVSEEAVCEIEFREEYDAH